MSIVLANTNYGKIRGVRKNDITVFRGIPYAKPPVGELRWKAPQKPEPWSDVLHANKFKARSLQIDGSAGDFYGKEFFSDEDFLPEISEDSLYLNIWTPASSDSEKLPVALWIHGGGFVQGYGTEPEMDGEAFAKKGVILVTFNYRLGAAGFLSHPWLSKENEHCISGNYGLLDQLAALDWLIENISAFGGDKDNITIFGQSAGCISVRHLIETEMTSGKISKAIMQSCTGYPLDFLPIYTMEDEYKKGEKFVELSGAKNLEELRALSSDEILEATKKLLASLGDTEGLPFAPVIDGYIIKDVPDELVKVGKHHDISYMIGCTNNEFDSKPDKLGALYHASIGFSQHNESLGRKPSYVYLFTHNPLGDDAGAFHSSELWYIFGTLNRSWRPKDESDWKLSEEMTSYWTNFIRCGDPNGEETEKTWQPCTKANPFVKKLD